MLDELKAVPLFAQLSDDDLKVLAKGVHRVSLEDRETLFHEGDKGDVTFLIESGELDITKTSSGRSVLLAVRKAGEVIGEMAVLEDVPRMASASASGPASVLGISKASIDHLLATSPAAVSAMFQTVLGKVRSTESRLRQSERMAQLGTLTAGVAHELNNPSAAIGRSSEQLAEAVARQAGIHVPIHLFSASAMELFDQLSSSALRSPSVEIDSLERSDREDETGTWLESRLVERMRGSSPLNLWALRCQSETSKFGRLPSVKLCLKSWLRCVRLTCRLCSSRKSAQLQHECLTSFKGSSPTRSSIGPLRKK